MELKISLLSDLESLRNSRVVVYCCGGREKSFPKAIQDEDVPILYECLRRLERTERLDLVLYTNGGQANAARRLALLLHDYTSRLNILVPYKARSAGTLLCLAAHQLVLGPMAELSPLDGQIGSAGDLPPGAPLSISAEDVRAFRQMAENWFDLHSEEHRIQIFALLSQRFFPTSLSAFYRADKQVRQVAEELLRYQLPDADPAVRQHLIEQLISGYHAHDYSLTRAEAQQLGLKVQIASPKEEALMWAILQDCQAYMSAPLLNRGQSVVNGSLGGVMVSTDFTAQYITWLADLTPAQALPSSGDLRPSQSTDMMISNWEILK